MLKKKKQRKSTSNVLCEHVYKYMGSSICPLCGKDTHETDWEVQAEHRRLYQEKHGLFYQAPHVWWSI